MKSKILLISVIFALLLSFMTLASILTWINGDRSETDNVNTEHTQSVPDSESETETADILNDDNWTKNY